MIKKNIKIIFEDNNIPELNNLIGGMPLSEGEVVHIYKNENEVIDYIVTNKKIDILLKDDDQIVNITFSLRKK
ncbi:MAG: hypothetical protein AAB969_03675 [Patescibacteria group bacterium]